MQIEELALTKQKAEREYITYKQELAVAKTQFNEDMKSLYAHMRHGGKVLDLWESMKVAGLNIDNDPKLAIVRADSPRVRFTRNLDSRYEVIQGIQQYRTVVNRGGSFLRFQKNHYSWKEWTPDIHIPNGFFPEWNKRPDGQYVSRTVETVTPIVPARIMNALRSHKLENYHILWEVEKWQPVPPRDPMLLKQITPNMFLILAGWDLSPLERAVIKGRI